MSDKIVPTTAGGSKELFDRWLRLQEACNQSGLDDDALVPIIHEMDAVQRAIFASDPATEEDWRALVAALCIGLAEGLSYVNKEAAEALYRRFVIERFTDSKTRRRETHSSQKRVENAKRHLAELAEVQS